MSLGLKPSHAAVEAYYETLHQFGPLSIDHEGAVRPKSPAEIDVVPECRIERALSSVIVDGAMVDLYHLPHGHWEAKDERDDLAREVDRKLERDIRAISSRVGD